MQVHTGMRVVTEVLQREDVGAESKRGGVAVSSDPSSLDHRAHQPGVPCGSIVDVAPDSTVEI